MLDKTHYFPVVVKVDDPNIILAGDFHGNPRDKENEQRTVNHNPDPFKQGTHKFPGHGRVKYFVYSGHDDQKIKDHPANPGDGCHQMQKIKNRL